MTQAQSNRRFPAFWIAPVAAVAAALFFEPISRVVLGWFTFEESHGLLIFAISLYMIWASRERLRGLPLEPNLLLGPLVLLSGCLVYLSAKWSATLLLEQVSLVLVLLGITSLILGNRWLRVLLLPISYLLFMFTAFQELLLPISGHLQQITAWIASGLLKLTGMPVLLSDNYITLPNITLVVARECNGSHHIIALVALALPLAYFTQETWLRRACVILAAFLIGMFANGLRVMLIGLWSISHSTEQLHGPFNLFYASFIFLFGMLFLLGGTLLSTRRLPTRRAFRHKALPVESSCPDLAKATVAGQPPNKSNKTLSSFIALTLLSGTLALAVFREPTPIHLDQAPTAMQMALDDWRVETEAHQPGGPFEQMKADEQFIWSYLDNMGRNVQVYVGYFPAQRQDSEIINDRFHWQVQKGADVPVPLEAGEAKVRKIHFRGETATGDFYYFYVVNGRILTSRYAVKLATMFDAIVKRRTNGAVVAVFVETPPRTNPLTQDEVVQFLGRLIPSVRAFIPS